MNTTLLIGGEKGGSGKTTLATNIVVEWQKLGRDLLLVDTDKQTSATNWAAVRSELSEEEQNVLNIPCIQLQGKGLKAQINELKSKHEFIVIDSGGRDTEELRQALLCIDLFVMPVRPSQYDVWTLIKISELVATAADYNERFYTYMMLSQVSPRHVWNSNLRAKSRDVYKTLSEDFENMNMMRSYTVTRAAYQETSEFGLGISEMKKPDLKAMKEINNIVSEIDQILSYVKGKHANDTAEDF